jgi:hypothetical protein
VCHHEPPEVASLCPLLVLVLAEGVGLVVGAEPELKPVLLFELLLVSVLLVFVVFDVVVLEVAAAWVDPGSASATTPAAITLVALTAAVAERTRA